MLVLMKKGRPDIAEGYVLSRVPGLVPSQELEFTGQVRHIIDALLIGGREGREEVG